MEPLDTRDEKLLEDLLRIEKNPDISVSKSLVKEISQNISKYLSNKTVRYYLIVITILASLGYYGYGKLKTSRELLEPSSVVELESGLETYMGNGIPSNPGISPLNLLYKQDYSFLSNESNSYLFELTDDEIKILETTNNFQEFREILKIQDPILRLQKIIEYLQVSTLENPMGNIRYSSNSEDGACNLYVTDILDLLFYNRSDDLLSYRTDLGGNPVTNPVDILSIDSGENSDFQYNNAQSLYIKSQELVTSGRMVDATDFTYEKHLEYLNNGYAFVVFLINEKDGMASHTMLEFGFRDEDGNIIPARTQATRNILGSEVRKDSVIFQGDEIPEFGKRNPRVFMFKIPE